MIDALGTLKLDCAIQKKNKLIQISCQLELILFSGFARHYKISNSFDLHTHSHRQCVLNGWNVDCAGSQMKSLGNKYKEEEEYVQLEQI